MICFLGKWKVYLVLIFTDFLTNRNTGIIWFHRREGHSFPPSSSRGRNAFSLLSVIKKTLQCFLQFPSPVLLHLSFVHSSPCLSEVHQNLLQLPIALGDHLNLVGTSTPACYSCWRKWEDLCCPSPSSKAELISDKADVKRLSQGSPALCGCSEYTESRLRLWQVR